jgi:hypothetical protein
MENDEIFLNGIIGQSPTENLKKGDNSKRKYPSD